MKFYKILLVGILFGGCNQAVIKNLPVLDTNKLRIEASYIETGIYLVTNGSGGYFVPPENQQFIKAFIEIKNNSMFTMPVLIKDFTIGNDKASASPALAFQFKSKTDIQTLTLEQKQSAMLILYFPWPGDSVPSRFSHPASGVMVLK